MYLAGNTDAGCARIMDPDMVLYSSLGLESLWTRELVQTTQIGMALEVAQPLNTNTAPDGHPDPRNLHGSHVNWRHVHQHRT